MDNLTGKRIRGYELIEQIGEGGFGAVYRAAQSAVDRNVAIKVILPEYANHPDFIRRFEKEAQLVARLEHFHIIPLYDYWREPDGAYLVMRYLRGGSLHDKLKTGGPLSIADVLQFLDQITAALDLAHRNGVIHRDLKPSNILLDYEGNFYLTDFGIAKDLGSTTNITETGELAITPAYASPEQVRQEIVAPQSDIYALGIILFETLCGQHPFAESGTLEVMVKHLNDPLPLIQSLRPDLPPLVDEVLQKATAKDTRQRFQTTLELAATFRDVLEKGEFIADDSEATRMIMNFVQPAINPYKGLRAFQEADAGDFFGRDNLIEQLLARLQEPSAAARFLAVVGPSGSGKSSVVKAGIVPALRDGALPNSDNAFIIEMFPSTHPFEELEAALLRVAINPPISLLEQLQSDQRGLVRAVKRILPGDTDSELVLVIDQFEELFTLVEDENTRQAFLDSLLAAIEDPYSRIRVIVTLRADFYDRPLLYEDLGHLIRQRTEVVLPLSSVELEQAIVEPAKAAGVSLESGLVSAIMNDVGEQPGTLPLLQYALTELFEQREGRLMTLSAYQASGGVLGALARRADEIFEALDVDAQMVVQQLFLRLVALGEGTEDTRRRVRRSEIAIPNVKTTFINKIIDNFGKHRLLTFDRDPLTREPTVEVAHEALIRSWSRLREWIAANRDDLRIHRRLTTAAAEWEEKGRDASYLAVGSRLVELDSWARDTALTLNPIEQAFLDASRAHHDKVQREHEARVAHELALQRRAANRLRYLVGGLLIFLVAAIGLSLFAFDQQQQADDERQAAVNAQDTAVAEANRRGTTQFEAEAASTAVINANRNAADAETQVAIANETLTPIPPTLTAVADAVQRGEDELAAFHLIGRAEAVYSQDPILGLSLALEANRMENPPAQVQQSLADMAYAPGPRRQFVGHTGRVNGVVFSPDGQTALSASEDGTLILWDIASGQQIRHFAGHQTEVIGVAFIPDGQTALSASADNTLILWDIASGQQIHRFVGHQTAVIGVAFSPDGQTALSASADNTLILWDITTGQQIRHFAGHTDAVNGVVFSPDGQTAFSASSDNTLILWDIPTGQQIRQFVGHRSQVFSVVFSPDGQTALSASNDRTLILWDIPTGQQIRQFVGHTFGVYGVVFSPDGQTALSSSLDSALILWDIASGEQLRRFEGHTDWVYGVVFSPDGQTALSASGDSTLILWDIPTSHQIRHFEGHTAGVNSVAFSPDGQTALSASEDNTLILWDIPTDEQIRQFVGHTDAVYGVAFSPNGQTALSASFDRTLILWDIATGEQIRQFVGHTRQVWSVAFSPNGETALSASEDNTLILWDIATGEQIRQFVGHTRQVWSVAFSPDGQTALSASADNTLILWDIATGEQIRQFVGHTRQVWSVAISPDGKTALSASEDSTLILWDIATGEQIRQFEGHRSQVFSVAFSPDGQTALSASEDNTLILWDVATGRQLRQFEGHKGGVYSGVFSVAFSPDGQTALSASSNNTLILWRIDLLDQPIDWTLNNRVVRPLTCDERIEYEVEPYCVDTTQPTSTFFPTPTVFPTSTIPVWTPIASATVSRTATP